MEDERSTMDDVQESGQDVKDAAGKLKDGVHDARNIANKVKDARQNAGQGATNPTGGGAAAGAGTGGAPAGAGAGASGAGGAAAGSGGAAAGAGAGAGAGGAGGAAAGGAAAGSGGAAAGGAAAGAGGAAAGAGAGAGAGAAGGAAAGAGAGAGGAVAGGAAAGSAAGPIGAGIGAAVGLAAAPVVAGVNAAKDVTGTKTGGMGIKDKSRIIVSKTPSSVDTEKKIIGGTFATVIGFFAVLFPGLFFALAVCFTFFESSPTVLNGTSMTSEKVVATASVEASANTADLSATVESKNTDYSEGFFSKIMKYFGFKSDSSEEGEETTEETTNEETDETSAQYKAIWDEYYTAAEEALTDAHEEIQDMIDADIASNVGTTMNDATFSEEVTRLRSVDSFLTSSKTQIPYIIEYYSISMTETTETKNDPDALNDLYYLDVPYYSSKATPKNMKQAITDYVDSLIASGDAYSEAKKTMAIKTFYKHVYVSQGWVDVLTPVDADGDGVQDTDADGNLMYTKQTLQAYSLEGTEEVESDDLYEEGYKAPQEDEYIEKTATVLADGSTFTSTSTSGGATSVTGSVSGNTTTTTFYIKTDKTVDMDYDVDRLWYSEYTINALDADWICSAFGIDAEAFYGHPDMELTEEQKANRKTTTDELGNTYYTDVMTNKEYAQYQLRLLASTYGINTSSISGTGDASQFLQWAQWAFDNGMGYNDGEFFLDYFNIDHGTYWCAIFVSWVADQCGFLNNGTDESPATFPSSRCVTTEESITTAATIMQNRTGTELSPSVVAGNAAEPSTVSMYKYFNEQGLTFTPSEDEPLKPGDIFWYWPAGAGRINHVGIVLSYDAETRTFTTLEGNSSNKVSSWNVTLSSDYVHISGKGTRVYFARPNYPAGSIGGTMEECAQKLYSILHELGLNDNQIAGALGNWQQESGIDSTKIECVYSDYGSDKWNSAASDLNAWTVNHVFPAYERSRPDIHLNKAGYRMSNGQYCCGIGIAQWTGPSAETIQTVAAEHDYCWYDFNFQIAYIIARCPTGRQNYWETYKSATAGYSASQCALYFMHTYEGVNSESVIGSRQSYAEEWASTIQTYSADSTYARTVLSLAEELK